MDNKFDAPSNFVEKHQSQPHLTGIVFTILRANLFGVTTKRILHLGHNHFPVAHCSQKTTVQQFDSTAFVATSIQTMQVKWSVALILSSNENTHEKETFYTIHSVSFPRYILQNFVKYQYFTRETC